MKTWKQGTIGKFALSGSVFLFMKCLKYPLAIIYEHYDWAEEKPVSELFAAFIELGELHKIEAIGHEKLSAEEKALGDCFSMHYYPGTSSIKEIEKRTGKDTRQLATIEKAGLCTIDDIGKRLKAYREGPEER